MGILNKIKHNNGKTLHFCNTTDTTDSMLVQ